MADMDEMKPHIVVRDRVITHEKITSYLKLIQKSEDDYLSAIDPPTALESAYGFCM